MTGDYSTSNGSPTAQASSGLRSPTRAHRSGSSVNSPAKLAPNHTLFMANIDYSPTRRKEELANGSLSTKVIESLHEQIDTLTNTNLQLTVQSHSLLDKLESAQQKESKLLENTASLKHENENITSMLNRKSRKLKDKEEEYAKLKDEHDRVLLEKSELEKQIRSTSEREVSLKEQVEMFRAQYDALVDSQSYHKEHYKSEVRALGEQVEELKQKQFSEIERHDVDARTLISKLEDFDMKFKNIQLLEKDRVDLLEAQCQKAINQLDLEAWVNLYRESVQTLFGYAEKMNLQLPPNVHQLKHEIDSSAPENRTSSTLLPLKVGKVRGNRAATSPNANTLPSSNHPKRSSFYGAATQFPTSAPAALPGVKRSSSRRTNSGKSEHTNSSADSSPVLRQGTRNASSPSPRMSSTSAFRKN